MNRTIAVLAFLLTFGTGFVLGQRGAAGAPRNPFQGNQEAIREGEQLYVQRCTNCHGPNGGAGDIGPAIVTQNSYDPARSDGQIFNSIKNGVPGTLMAPQPLSDDEIWKIAAYFRALRGTAIDNPSPGDTAHGEQVFWEKGQCGTCHMMKGKGGLTAPDLSNIAGQRKYSSIVAALTQEQHKTYGSGGAHLKELSASDAYLPVHATTADGKVIDGVLLNEDTYSLQMIGNDQKLYLLDKAKLRKLVVEPKSLMPTDYDKRLTPEEFKDLLAFLTRQGRKTPARGRGGQAPED